MEKRGRIGKLSHERQEALCAAVEIGCTFKLAAAYAGISEDALNEWRKRGSVEIERVQNGEPENPAEQKYAELVRALRHSELVAGVTWQQVVSEAATTDPNWALKMLRFRFPEDYREPPSGMEVTGADGGPLRIEFVNDWRTNSD